MKEKLEKIICVGEKGEFCFLNEIAHNIICPYYNLQTGICEPFNYKRVEVEFEIKKYLIN